MAKNQKKVEEGAPLWVLTYGDMMSLLLVFFIMLVALSEIKKEDEWKAIAAEVQKAFGIRGGGGKLPTKDDPELTLQERLEAIMIGRQRKPNQSNVEDPGLEGRETQVTQIRPAMKWALGGPIVFEPGSADLTERARMQLQQQQQISEFRDTNYLIELRGHAAPIELAEDSDLSQEEPSLSYKRAKVVLDYLTGDPINMRPKRFRIVDCGAYEPVAHRAYTPLQRRPNRRVEVILSEALIQEFDHSQSGP